MAKDTKKQLSTQRGGSGKRAKPKPKSNKAKVTNKMNSTRRLSRYGKVQKKGNKGIAAAFMTRSKALRKLQLSLKDFRRLCILKGVYPRDPKKKSEGQDKTYYHIKDVTYLAHEPILDKFRDLKAFMKKVRKSAGKKEFSETQRMDKVKPEYSLDHIVVERYPNFTDALEDLDDALCMIHLFAHLPAEAAIHTKYTQRAATLAREWQFIMTKHHCIQKVFVSIKGVYYQAEIQGVEINWLAPHEFTQNMPKDVDYRVMLTFLEFYETLLKFVNYKLFKNLGLKYPPKLNPNKNKKGSNLMALTLKPIEPATAGAGDAMDVEDENDAEDIRDSNSDSDDDEAQAARLKTLPDKLKQIASESGSANVKVASKTDGDEDVDAPVVVEDAFKDSEEAIQMQKEQSEDAEVSRRQRIFQGMHFYLGREVPQRSLELVIRAFAGEVSWDGDGSGVNANDERITHQVMDRPTQGHRYFTCEYVQPQWVFDSANNRLTLPVGRYAPGETLPPHLSPFVDDEREGYVPEYRSELDKYTSAAQAKAQGMYSHESEEEASDSDEEALDAEEVYAKELEAESQGKAYPGEGDEANADSDGEDEDEDEDKEEEAPVTATNKSKRQREEDEHHELRVNMMSKKAKRLYGRMQHGIQEKQSTVKNLTEKRKKLKKK